MMDHAFDSFLPGEMSWRELFDLIIVSARKPDFFASRSPFFEVVDLDQGLLRPLVGPLAPGGIYLGGNAQLVEQHLGLSGHEILYVGDHIFGDVHVTKKFLRWRTALVLRELEHEIVANQTFRPRAAELARLMEQKEQLEYRLCQLRIQEQRRSQGYGPQDSAAGRGQKQAARLKEQLQQIDDQVAPLARQSAEVSNAVWGPLMRAGNDKSLLTRQVERSADIYTSRVSNFLFQTPFAYLRSPRGGMPHDPG